MSKDQSLSAAISTFGVATKRKLANSAASGAPEDQLRAPLESLVAELAELSGHTRGQLSLVGETTLAHLSTRPDYAVTLRNALIGFIEVKSPGTGADPRRFTDEHNKKQWGNLKCLPNLVYTDGNSFSLWRDGVLQGSILRLEGDVESSGASLAAPPGLEALFTDLSLDLDKAANELRKSSTLIGTALRLLVDDDNIKKALHTSLDTLRRVLNEVDWPTITKGNPEAWLYIYEDFLEVYDNKLRKKTGSYYTPPEVVNAMVRLTDEALRDPALFNRREGLAAPTVTICDPAVGTGPLLSDNAKGTIQYRC